MLRKGSTGVLEIGTRRVALPSFLRQARFPLPPYTPTPTTHTHTHTRMNTHTHTHTSLPLRFWVNLIKNPDFVFDIHKSATVDACLTIIAQAYIDACSTAELRYTKDTPSARLLYVNEVKNYKNEVRQ